MAYLEKAREFLAKDRFASAIGIRIDEVDDGFAKCSLALGDIHLNAEGNVMGGVLFTLADFAFAVAANLNQPNTVTLSSQTTFLSPARGKTLIAEAHRIRQGHSTCYYQVSVTDETNAIVAMVGITGFIKRDT